MAEGEFLLFSQLITGFVPVLSGVGFTAFVSAFFEKRTVGRLLAAGCGYLACCFISGGRMVSLPLVLLMLALAAGKLGLNRAAGMLAIALFYSAKSAAAVTAGCLSYLAGRQPPPDNPAAIYRAAAGNVSLLLGGYLVFLALFLWLFRRRLAKGPLALGPSAAAGLCLVPALGILFGNMVAKLLFEVRDGAVYELYGAHPVFLALVPLMAGLFICGSLLAVAARQRAVSLQQEQLKRVKAADIAERLACAEESYNSLRQEQHQFRSHLAVLQGLAAAEEYGALKQYLAKLGEQGEAPSPTVQTGNAVLDAVVGSRQRQAAGQQTLLKVAVHFPSNAGYDPFSLGIILDNLLQNALEACEKLPPERREATLSGCRKGRFFLIEAQNPFDGKILPGEQGLPCSTKKDSALHGLGLLLVQQEAERYMGGLTIRTEGQRFYAAVLLQERSNEDEPD